LFQAVVNFIAHLLQIIYEFLGGLGVPNYGLAIIILTVLVKLTLFPLTQKQFVSLRKIQEIQPELQEAQKKYKDNPQKAQQATMEVYQKYGVNPAGGCWPIAVQIPILWALFSMMRTFFDPKLHPDFVNLEHAKFLWVPNLGNPDPTVILPILVGLATFAQQKITSTGMTPPPVEGTKNPMQTTQNIMLYAMPLLFAWWARSFPAGLSLYWVTYSLMGMAEQTVIRRKGQSLPVKEGAPESHGKSSGTKRKKRGGSN
jgi:YidC/Oxa1 family membrane protein insertase